MLDFLRKNIKKFAILLWIATAAFIVGGAYLFVSGPFKMGSNTAIQVGNVKISIPEYEKTYNDIYKFYVQLLTQLKGGNITENDIKHLNIKKKTIDTLINRALLLEEAQKEGIKVTKKDVIETIQSNPAFFINGKFSKEKYLALLKANNINPKDYEESLKTSIYINKLKQKLFKNIKVSDKEVKNFFDKNYSKINLIFVSLSSEGFRDKIKPTEEQLKQYYDKNKEKYRIPTLVRFKYIAIPLSYVEKKITLNDNETLQFYKNHKQYFQVPLRIKVAHILIAKKDNKTTDKVLKEKAETVYKLIKDGKITFKEAVKKYSDDKYSKNNGGDLGYITKDMVDNTFWNHIVKLKKGEISKPFKTKFGYHIVMVEDIKQPFIRPYKDVKKEIEKYLKQMKAKKIWFIEADKIFVRIRDSKEPMDKIARKLHLIVKETPYMSLNKPIPPFTSVMIQNALIEGKGKLLGPDLSSQGYLIYKIMDKKPSHIPLFKQIKNKVKNDFINQKSEEFAIKEAKKILKLAKKEKNLAIVAKEKGLKIKKVEDMTKLTPTDKFKCSFKEDVVNEIFSHSKGFIGMCKSGKKVYVFQIENKIFDKKEFKKLKNSIRQQILEQKQNEVLEQLLSKLRKETKIRINPKL